MPLVRPSGYLIDASCPSMTEHNVAEERLAILEYCSRCPIGGVAPVRWTVDRSRNQAGLAAF